MAVVINERRWTLEQMEAVERAKHDADFKVVMQILLSSRAELLESLANETRESEMFRLQGAAQFAEAFGKLVDSSSEIADVLRRQKRGS